LIKKKRTTDAMKVATREAQPGIENDGDTILQ